MNPMAEKESVPFYNRADISWKDLAELKKQLSDLKRIQFEQAEYVTKLTTALNEMEKQYNANMSDFLSAE